MGQSTQSANRTIRAVWRVFVFAGIAFDQNLDSAELASGLRPGQAVHFSFEDRGDGEFVITAIETMDAAADTPAAGSH